MDALPCASRHALDGMAALDAKDRPAVDAFTRSDPYHVNKVWETVQIHGYNKKRGTRSSPGEVRNAVRATGRRPSRSLRRP